MERREYEMSCKRCLSGNVGCLEITYLPDHNNIGILPKQSLESGCVRVIVFLVYFGLHHSLQFVFDRIFKGYDFFIRGIERREYRVERSSFTASCRSSYQNHAVLFLSAFFDLTLRCPHESKLAHDRNRVRGIEYATYDIFSEFHRERRHAHVDTIQPIFDAVFPVLRNLSEIEFHIGLVFESFQDKFVFRERELKNSYEIPIDTQSYKNRI